jgi:hypothetical protein
MTLQELADILHVIEPGSLSEAALGVCVVWWLMRRLDEIEERVRLLQARSSRGRGARHGFPRTTKRATKRSSRPQNFAIHSDADE